MPNLRLLFVLTAAVWATVAMLLYLVLPTTPPVFSEPETPRCFALGTLEVKGFGMCPDYDQQRVRGT